MSETARTGKIEPLDVGRGQSLTVDPHARLLDSLKEAAVWAPEVGKDIADAIYKLLASVKRRQIEQLPDITQEAEAA